MRPCQRLDFNLILHCDDIIKSIENLERAWQFYHWCNLCFGWASVECGFSSLMSMLNQFMALIRKRIRLKLNQSHTIKRNHFVRTCQKDALNERYDDLYLEIRDDNGMIYDVSSTDQLALHLSMNHTELVEMQYKSMYDLGTFWSQLDYTLTWPYLKSNILGTQEAAKMLLIQPITGMTMSVLFGSLEIYNKFAMKYILILTNWQGFNLK